MISQDGNQIDLTLHAAQMEVFRNKSRFRVLVAGRRTGKCIEINELVLMGDRTYKPAWLVEAGDIVMTINERTYELELKPVVASEDNGVRGVVKVSTHRGDELIVTPNHPILTQEGWVEAGDLTIDHFVASYAYNKKPHEEEVCWVRVRSVTPHGESQTLDLQIQDNHNFIVGNVVTHNTHLAVTEIIRASKKPKQRIWYVAPTYRMAKDIVWNDLKERLPRRWVKNIHETYMIIWLVNGTQIQCKGADKPDCYDDQTEILTDSGWKLFKDLDKTESVLTLNPKTLKAEYKKPERYINEPYSGKMYSVANDKLDLLVTPEHRFFVKSAKGVYKFKTLDDLSYSDSIPASVGWDGIDDPEITLDRCALMGFFLADGSAYGSMGGDITKRRGNYEVVFCKQDEVKGGTKGNVRRQFAEVLDRLGYNYRESKIGLHILNKALWSEMREVGNCYEKFIPERYKNLPPEKLRVLLHWMIMGDGIMRESGMRQYYTTSKRLADDVQEISAKAGFSATTRIRAQKPSVIDGRDVVPTKTIYQVTIHGNKYNYFRNTKDGSYISETTYDGRVYCVEVENHVVMVRRNGKMCWSGNSLRGVGLDFIVLDEVQDIHPDAWNLVLRPTLASTGGRALMTGTPKSFNLLHSLYQFGQDPKKTEWASWQFPTITSPFIPQSEIDAAREDLDEKSFAQEFLGSFISMSGRVYYPFDRSLHVGTYMFNPGRPIWVGQDFNIDPMSSVILQPQRNGEVWAVDEIVLPSASTSDVVLELEKRYWRYVDNVVIYPDATGSSRQHARGESDLDIFREKGFGTILHHSKNPPIADRVNAVNRMLRNARGDVRLKIDRSCGNLIRSLDQTIYRPGSREINKKLGTDHASDALGYVINYEFPVRKYNLAGISL